MILDPHHARLCAEALAAPLCRGVAFRDALTTLRRGGPGVLEEGAGGSTSRLAGEFDDWVRTRADGASMDALRGIREHVWFRPEGGDFTHETPLHLHLARWAEELLEVAGGGIALTRDGPERTMFWRQISLALPSDLLVAARLARPSAAGMPPIVDASYVAERVELLSPPLRRMLHEAPVAETHLHVGSSIPFDILWTSWMIEPPDAGRAKALPSDAVLGDARSMSRWILVAGIARSLMARFLQRPSSAAGFRAWLDAMVDARVRDPRASGLRRAVDDLRAARETFAYARVRSTFRYWLFAPRRRVKDLDDFLRGDPLGAWWPYARGRALSETRFCAAALVHLQRTEAADAEFAALFWQYQRVRCRLFRYLVEEAGTEGLEWFTAHFDRISPLRRAIDTYKYAVALRTQSQGVSLGALEARTSPGGRWQDIRDEVRHLARDQRAHLASCRERRPAVGLVLHFLKQRVHTIRGASREHASPVNLWGYRYASLHHHRWREARAIAKALALRPRLLYVLRGVDVASRELDAPTWVYVAPIIFARDASRATAVRLRAQDPTREVDDLRVTLHTGEDFRTLAQGLRRVHEGMEAGLLRRGDRIGHGLALGVDPARWVSAARGLVVPREEALDDLLWQIDRHSRDGVRCDAARLAHLRSSALELAREVHGPGDLSVEALCAVRRCLLRSDVTRALVERGVSAALSTADLGGLPERIFRQALTDRATYQRAREPVLQEMGDGDAAALAELQRWVRAEAARLALTIETNPSSNFVIGRMASIEEHPVFRVRPLRPDPSAPPLMVSINTDNPLTFASCLGDEFAFLYDAMLGADVPADEALAWIDRARDAGYRSRFTLSASTDEALLKTL